jgi:putative FmdB family regulatory protein
MPLYEYQCRECGNRFEAMRRMSERTNAPACARCGSVATTLAMSASAFVGGGGGGGGGSAASACSTWTGGG